MTTATVQVGRLVLREDLTIPETVDSSGVRTMKLTGQESIPRLSAATVAQRRSDLLGMLNAFVPVVFSTKALFNGYYRIVDCGGEIEDWGGGIVVFRWNMTLRREGTIAEIDIESRLSGAQTRVNDFGITGDRVHAPSGGAVAYWAGTSVPTVVDRASQDGTVRLYRALGLTVNPRWIIVPELYGVGRCRLIDVDGQERAGMRFSLPAGSWQLTNGIMNVTPGTGGATFTIGTWDSGVWTATSWIVQTGSPYVAITTFDTITVLRNDYETITLRFVKSFTTNGRLFVDVTVRRGSRVVELYCQNEYGTNMKVLRSVAAVGTQTAGYVTANANDADGNRYAVMSARTFTADTTIGGVEKLATPTLDVGIGVVLNGNTAVSGDTAADLYTQYLGMPTEVVQGVKR